MKILVNSDFSFASGVLEKLHIGVTICDNNTSILTLPENSKMHTDMVLDEHLPRHTHERQLSKYINSSDTSLKDFITVGSKIIATGDFQKVDEDLVLPYDYIANSDFRVFDKENAIPRTFEYIASGQVIVEDYYHYLERMLENSTVIHVVSNNKTL